MMRVMSVIGTQQQNTLAYGFKPDIVGNSSYLETRAAECWDLMQLKPRDGRLPAAAKKKLVPFVMLCSSWRSHRDTANRRNLRGSRAATPRPEPKLSDLGITKVR